MYLHFIQKCILALNTNYRALCWAHVRGNVIKIFIIIHMMGDGAGDWTFFHSEFLYLPSIPIFLKPRLLYDFMIYRLKNECNISIFETTYYVKNYFTMWPLLLKKDWTEMSIHSRFSCFIWFRLTIFYNCFCYI